MVTTPDLPRSLTEFEQRFGDEDACAEYLAEARWPDGFVCPGCLGVSRDSGRSAAALAVIFTRNPKCLQQTPALR